MCEVLEKVLMVFLVAAFAAGCAITKRDLLAEKVVAVEFVPVNDVEYLYGNVVQNGAEVHISGMVALSDPKTARNVPSHMDIELYASGRKEQLIFASSTPYRQHDEPGKRNHVRFLSAAWLLVPENSVVVMKHHFGSMEQHKLIQ